MANTILVVAYNCRDAWQELSEIYSIGGTNETSTVVGYNGCVMEATYGIFSYSSYYTCYNNYA